MESVPENRGKTDKYDQRKDEIVQKLSDKRGNVSLHTVRELSVRIFTKGSSDGEIQHIVDQCGGNESNRASEQNKPRSAEYTVVRRIVVCV